METYKVRYMNRGEDAVMYFSNCKDRADALERAQAARDCGFRIWSVRKVGRVGA
jgi:hypothetical protein